MKYIIILLLFSGCMINEDWHTHRLEINTETEILLVDGIENSEDSFFNYKLDPSGVGITFICAELVDHITWHWNVDSEIRYEPTITRELEKTIIEIPHNFNQYPGPVFIATTYLHEEHWHLIRNLN